MKTLIKKLLSSICVLTMSFAAFGVPVVAEQPETDSVISNDGVTLDKTATPLEGNDTTVTLSVGSTENREKAAVLFLLDKSTSVGMRDEAAGMLDELATKNNMDIIYDVVIFSGTATSSGWNDISDEDNLDTIKSDFVNRETTSGTNMDEGIEMAQNDINSLPEGYENAATYLVVLSDGITYIWSEDDTVKGVPVQGLGANENVETNPQNGTDTWAMMYGYGKTLQDIYGGNNTVEAVNNFKTAITDKMSTTVSEGHVQDYYGENNLANPIDTYIYDDIKNTEQSEKYAIGPDFAMYQSITGFESLINSFDYEFAYAVPELSGTEDNTTNWENYPWGKEIMLYMHALCSDSENAGEISNADAQSMFSTMKNRILYTVEDGVVTDVIGNDFDLKDLNSFDLKVAGETLEKHVEGNVVTFGEATDGEYPYVVTYHPATDTELEYFEWQINVPVEANNGLTLSYNLTIKKNETTGDYTVPTNESATLEYHKTDDAHTYEAVFPVPQVTYHVASIQPADMTIYMGGTNGYEGVMSDAGVETENSLPEPGYYLTLPDAVNTALGEIVTGGEPADLSEYVTITGKDSEGNEYTWTLEQYGETYSAAYNKFIYKIVPAEGTTPVRLMFQDEEGNLYDSDTFNPADEEALNQQYQMRIYSGLTADDLVEITVSVPDGNSYTCTLKTQPGTLNIRYVTGDQNSVVTSSYTSVKEASQADDPSQTALKKAYVIADEDTQFFINESQVDVTDEAAVSLLFDDIVTSDTTEGVSNYREVLVNKALEQLNLSDETDVNSQEKYLDLVDANNGNVWLTPGNDVTVYWPYPENTSASTKFYLVHFKGLDREMSMDSVETEIANAEVEVIPVTTDEYGISFTTDSFSPYVLIWTEEAAVTPDVPTEPDTGTTDTDVIETGVWTNPVPFAVTFTASMAAVLAILYRRLH